MEIFEFTLNKGDADYNRELYMAKSNLIWWLWEFECLAIGCKKVMLCCSQKEANSL